jgi:hypothetical protein
MSKARRSLVATDSSRADHTLTREPSTLAPTFPHGTAPLAGSDVEGGIGGLEETAPSTDGNASPSLSLSHRHRRSIESPEKENGAAVQPSELVFHHSIYVYGDFVENQFVGDYSVPLLHQFALKDPEYGQYVTMSPRHLVYLPVSAREIYSPLVYLRDEAGRKIEFNYGVVTVLLHFRRRL